MKISAAAQKQLASSPAGKELLNTYSEHLSGLLSALLVCENEKFEALRGEARNMITALRALTGRKVILKIEIGD